MLTNKYVSALRLRYEAQIAEAEANLALYLSGHNLSAIGEHSDIMEEQDKWLGRLSEAKDKLEALGSLRLEDENIQKQINS
jgi:hypothetical protein